jgi:hypothetical protein
VLSVLAETAAPTVSGGDAVIVGVVFAGFNAVVELAKFGFRRLNGSAKFSADGCAMAQRHTGILLDLHEKVSRTDSSGTPLIYGHRGLMERLGEILIEMRELVRLEKERVGDEQYDR